MAEIDKMIDKHGDWPGAFSGKEAPTVGAGELARLSNAPKR